jgi:lipopolysaccharide/colanic/teichoic acid biosynthesis glycosyltransferase
MIVIVILITLPIQIVIALCILVTSGWPVFYSQNRVGKGGKIFKLFKFRTMIVGAEKLQVKYRAMNEADGPVFKIRNDPRFTRFGKFLSRTGLDELPQLFNVLKGEMALIGPRPLPVSEASKLTSWQKERHSILPGIISPWVLDGYHANSFDSWMKNDISYSKKKNIFFDSILFIRTIAFMCTLLWREVRERVLSLKAA